MDIGQVAWVLDEPMINERLRGAIDAGTAVFHDGVAYWAKGSGRGGIIQHLPLKQVPAGQTESIASALSTAQTTTMLATAASTTIIVGAIIVQTRYLAAKIEGVRRAVEQVSSKIDEQNLVFHLDRLSSYLGHMETCRTLLVDRDAVDEIRDLAIGFLPNFMSARNHVLSMTHGICRFAESREVSAESLKAMLGFSLSCLDIVPKGVHLEYLLSARIGKIGFAEQILIEGSKAHAAANEEFRLHLNRVTKKILSGSAMEGHGQLLAELDSSAKAVLNSRDNAVLLTLPERRAELQRMQTAA